MSSRSRVISSHNSAKTISQQASSNATAHFDFRNKGVVVADVRAHALQQGPYVEGGSFAAVGHVCLRMVLMFCMTADRAVCDADAAVLCV